MIKSLLTRKKKRQDLDTVSPAASARAGQRIADEGAKASKQAQLRAVGVNNAEDEKHRAHRLADMGFDEGSSAAKLMDSWDITEMVSTVGSGDDALTETAYLPYPLWDDESVLHRQSYPTYDQAVRHVEKAGGTLLAKKTPEGADGDTENDR